MLNANKAITVGNPPRLIPTAHVQSKPVPPIGLILEVVINSRSLVLRYTLLLPIHLGDLSARRRHVWLLVISDLDETRESQTDTPIT